MKNKFFMLPGAVAMTALGLGAASCSMTDAPDHHAKNAIIASVKPPTQTRTAVDGNPADGVVGILWTAGDQLGVFDADAKSQILYSKAGTENEAKGVFTTASKAGAPAFAYYPYSADNDGKAATSLTGVIPLNQDMAANNIPGDYKYGAPVSGNANDGYQFEFQHLFSLIRVEVSAESTIFADDAITEITYNAKRNDSDVNIAGAFTFNATNGQWSATGTTDPTVTLTWEEGVSLADGLVTVHSSVFPNVRQGDELTFTFKTAKGYNATFTAKSKVSFARENMYLFPFHLAAIAENYKDSFTVKDSTGNDVTSSFVTSGNPNPDLIEGSFTCATFNVDGLPQKINFFTINGDGPGSDGTKLIGQAANEYGWDFFGVSEDFAYDSELTSALSKYNSGTWRGSVSAAQLTSTADTDGMNFFWEKEGVKAENETYIQFTDSYGGLTSGANDCIKKGFRYYLVTLADGTELDVYITHMNTFSGSDITESNGYVRAVHNQTRQVVEYIKEHKNGRPILFMGDTNMRYTRHRIKELLIDGINGDDDLTIVDPWVDLVWNNDFSSVGGDTYPKYGDKSLMVSDATKTNASTDIIISESDGGLQKGEVVDKVFYINVKGAKTQIKATKYLRDTSFKKADGTPLADHYPIVVSFSYTRQK